VRQPDLRHVDTVKVVADVGSMEPVSVASDGAVLAGEVWAPVGAVAAGTVVIGGSGPSDRSNGGYFDAYRAALADHGVAGLWYDKRGVAGSSGDYLTGTLNDLATDALAAADLGLHAWGGLPRSRQVCVRRTAAGHGVTPACGTPRSRGLRRCSGCQPSRRVARAGCCASSAGSLR
jgi:hypothetical protein